MQSNYKNNTLPFADISAKYQTEMDKVDITSKETIQVETVNKSDYSDEEISEFLKDKPYTACGELVTSYRIQVLEEKEMNGSAAITNEVLRSWGITKEQLHQDAVQAEKERKPACLYRMDDILFSEQAENLLEEGAPLQAGELPIFVLTNHDKSEGAGVMVQDGVLKKVGRPSENLT